MIEKRPWKGFHTVGSMAVSKCKNRYEVSYYVTIASSPCVPTGLGGKSSLARVTAVLQNFSRRFFGELVMLKAACGQDEFIRRDL